MFHTPDYYYNASMKLSETLDVIGVNERLVMKTRRSSCLRETIQTVTERSRGGQLRVYLLGSQSEGSTTLGLQSDKDTLVSLDDRNVIQDWSEWTPGVENLLMIQDKAPPGYCHLQILRSDAPLPVTEVPETLDNHAGRDTQGRILLKNTYLDTLMPGGTKRQGPSFESQGIEGLLDNDMVPALPCMSWPNTARKWTGPQEPGGWPTLKMKKYAVKTGAFVVGVGSKLSDSDEFEWRISTSMAERCLMFNLNITQLRCYILMKIILKAYLISHKKLITSFMCKTVLFHCIKNTRPSLWEECNILSCLTYCLLTLKRCVSTGNCPHFIICENNLMAGKFSMQIKYRLLKFLSKIITSNGMALLGIPTDKLGVRLQLKIQEQYLYSAVGLTSAADNNLAIAGTLFRNFAMCVHLSHLVSLSEIIRYSPEILTTLVLGLIRHYREGNDLERKACRIMAPLFCSTAGSLLASHNIQHDNEVSPQALTLMSAGLDSDVASSRLKLAAVYYCTGDMERTELVLRDIEQQYDTQIVENVCTCYTLSKPEISIGFCGISSRCNEDETMLRAVAFCVRFLPSEMNCVPRELQYEMFRSTPEERLQRNIEDNRWMDLAVVDAHPFLYFLQYKTYGYLQRFDHQQRALNDFARVIEHAKRLGHRETALNLLGQCLEQENRPNEALQCYMLSYNNRPRNNAARIHTRRLLANCHEHVIRLPHIVENSEARIYMYKQTNLFKWISGKISSLLQAAGITAFKWLLAVILDWVLETG